MRLLERGDELGLLAGAVERAVAGGGCLVLVAGEAGIGKTSLVRAMRGSLPDRVAFVAGACEPLSVPVPLAPLRELLNAAGAGDLGAPASDDRLAQARSVLSALSDRAPVLAVVEDAHWADPLTPDVLRIVSRRVEEAGIVVVVTYRDDEVGANPPLGLLLGDLATSPAVRRLGASAAARAFARHRAMFPACSRSAPLDARQPGRPDAARAGGAGGARDRRLERGDRRGAASV